MVHLLLTEDGARTRIDGKVGTYELLRLPLVSVRHGRLVLTQSSYPGRLVPGKSYGRP